jgi:hypothetical protein
MSRVFKLKLDPDDILVVKNYTGGTWLAEQIAKSVVEANPGARNPILCIPPGVSLKKIPPEKMEMYGWVRK